MVSSPITCCAATHWASTAHGMRRPQHKKAGGAFRPLERGLQRMQQRFGILQISGVKSFREPVVDRGEQVMGFLAFALLLPESSETGGSAEFPGFRTLGLGDGNGLVETGCSFGLVV